MLEFGTDVSDEPEADPIPFAVTAYSLSKRKTVRETFHARGEVPSSWLTLGRIVGDNIITTTLEIRDFIARVLIDTDREAFLAFVDDPDHRTEAQILKQIFDGLQGAYLNAGNPDEVPVRPTRSAAGSTPRRSRSGGTTTRQRSSKGSTSSGSLSVAR